MIEYERAELPSGWKCIVDPEQREPDLTKSQSDLPGSRPTRRLVTVVGARPQFVKAFPLSRELRLNDRFDEILVHTGQHFDWNMSDIFFAELGIESPRYNLNIHGGGHGAMTGCMLQAIEEILVAERPAGILVYGDTNSTLAGALAAAKCAIPVIHVEAGLRSHNRRMPEEVNRVVVDHLSSLLFCPTSRAVANLASEGITSGVHRVGDLMFDAAKIATPLARQHSGILGQLGLEEKGYGVATFHRQENLDDPDRVRAIVTYLREQSRRLPLVVPLHPRTRDVLEKASIDFRNDAITAIAPVGYLDMCRLIEAAATIFTDSGGLQREAYFHRVPCVTLRDETEWIETVDCGWNRLWICTEFGPRREIPELEKENAAEAIIHVLDQYLA
jgi:UDP-GlcNAc3NAcA epimerase